jgi:raffinose/stachyose/melibiose transport system substrate-binding protein
MVQDAGMIPAYSNVKLSPTGQLSASVQSWAASGKIYAWNQGLTTGDFRDKSLAPIYNQFANGAINKAKFIELFTTAVANYGK